MKRRVSSLLLACALVLAFIPAVSADDAPPERGVLRYEELIAPRYEDAKLFNDGLAPVKQDGKWGYINLEGEVVIGFKYDVANIFSEGLAVVGTFATREVERYDWSSNETVIDTIEVINLGVIDESGIYKPLSATRYDEVTNGYKRENHYIAKSAYTEARDYYYYGGWVVIGGALFGIDGNDMTSPDGYPLHGEGNAVLHVPTEGLIRAALVPVAEGGIGYYDMDGRVALESGWKSSEGPKYIIPVNGDYVSNVYPFNQGLAIAWVCQYGDMIETDEYAYMEEIYRFGFIDKTGGWVIEPQFEDYYVMGMYTRYQIFADNGLASVKKDGKYGAIDKTGKTVINFQFDELWSFFEDRAAFKQDGLYGYVDSQGNVLIEAQYQAASGFWGGCGVVYDGTDAFIIDRNGGKVPGSDALDPSTYFREVNGSPVTYTPGEYVVVQKDGVYGYGKLSYLPPLPDPADMDGWAYEQVVKAIEADLVPASLQNMYRRNITRADYCKLVMKAVCEILGAEREDLVLERTGKKLSAWVKEYPFVDTVDYDVLAAFALDLVTGYPADSTFRPYNQITRQEAAVLVTRAAGVLGMNTANPPRSDFVDRDSLASWSASQVDFVRSIDVMNGVGGNTFSPMGFYTRQQSFVSIYRLLLALRG